MTIELQDDAIGQLRVLVENDRLLTPGSHEVPIPVVEETGTVPFFRMNHRYATIERAGRDEVVVEPGRLRKMEALGRGQKQWETLTAVLGHEMTMAYLAASDARQPRLGFHTQSHAEVATVKARIGLAETTLAVDGAGAYRGQLALRVDNATEQFLEIRLPEGGRLWTARVAGEPVKPTAVPGSTDARRVRIPLIKTAPGELYYEVLLKYGGRMRSLGAWGNLAFPLIHTVNISPDLSQVRLYLPEQYRWYDFGGTMRLVREEADLQAGYMQFQNRQLTQIGLALHEGDKWTKARAEANLQVQQTEISSFRSSLSSVNAANRQLQSQLAANDSLMRQAEQEAAQAEQPQTGQVQDNRQRLNVLYQGQTYTQAGTVVGGVGYNWADAGKQPPVPSGKGWAARSRRNQPAQKPLSVGTWLPGTIVQEEEKELPFSAATTNKATNAARGEDESTTVERYKQRLAQQGTQQVQMYQTSGANIVSQSAPPLGLQSNYRAALGPGYGGPGSAPPSATTSFAPTPAEAALPGLPPAAADEEAGVGAGVGKKGPSHGESTYTIAKPRWETPPAQPAATAGMASLDFDLPTPGVLYRFTTPQGDVEITARHVSGNLLGRLIGIAALVVGLLVLWFAVRAIGRANIAPPRRPVAAMLLVLVGLVSLCSGILPLAGLAAIAVGCGLEIHRQTAMRRGAS